MEPEPSLSEVITEHIRTVLSRRRMKQWQLAAHLDQTEAWLSRRMQGHVSWSIADLEDIAEDLDMPVLTLINGEQLAAAAV